MVDPKKIANNILDFLIDPTKVPVKERVYFRPEETLSNGIYESAKADAVQAYKDQKFNSDFYPQKTRKQSKSQEAHIMDRKSLIVSMDVLSRNFKNEQDPFAVSLRTMAMALAKLDDSALSARLASEAPELEEVLIEAKGKAETFPCPKCGTNVLMNTKYCIKCKGKVEPKTAAEDKEAMYPIHQSPSHGRDPGSSAQPGGGKPESVYPEMKTEMPAIMEKKIKTIYEEIPPMTKEVLKRHKDLSDALEIALKEMGIPSQRKEADGASWSPAQKGDWLSSYSGQAGKIKSIYDRLPAEDKKSLDFVKKILEVMTGKKASEDFWTKEASEAVTRALISDVTEKEPKKKDCMCEEEGCTCGVSAAEEADAPKAPEAEKLEIKEVPAEEPVTAKKEMSKKEEEDTTVESRVVDTKELLASFGGIEVPVGYMSMDDVGELSESEKSSLAKLF